MFFSGIGQHELGLMAIEGDEKYLGGGVFNNFGSGIGQPMGFETAYAPYVPLEMYPPIHISPPPGLNDPPPPPPPTKQDPIVMPETAIPVVTTVKPVLKRRRLKELKAAKVEAKEKESAAEDNTILGFNRNTVLIVGAVAAVGFFMMSKSEGK